jgi:hypothetical protein
LGKSGIEPPLRELMNDPIMLLLLRRDGLTRAEVWAFLEGTRDRLARNGQGTASVWPHGALRQPFLTRA